VIVADRDMVETEADAILANAQSINVAFLVVGDPFGCALPRFRGLIASATTHSDLVLRAKELDIPVQVIHNASVMNAVGCCGLQLYKFGQAVSIVFFTDTWRPDSFYDRVKSNKDAGLHTLLLLGEYHISLVYIAHVEISRSRNSRLRIWPVDAKSTNRRVT
jgi:diphthine synthase